jgi:hypothetical protein
MNKNIVERYNSKTNTGNGDSLHKDVLLDEAKKSGWIGLQNATKTELMDLLYIDRTPEEDEKFLKVIKQNIKDRATKAAAKTKEAKSKNIIVKENTNVLEMNLSESDLKIIEEVNSYQHSRVIRYYDETFNSNYPEINHIENRLKYDEYGVEFNFSPSKKELKWCEEKKKDFIDYVNSEYNMNWDSFYDILTWSTGNGDDFAPRNKDNVDFVLGCEKRQIANDRRKEMKERSIMLLNKRLLDDITQNPDGIEI